MQYISILGSTGSIGTQALNIVAANPDKYAVYALAANSNVKLIKQQLVQFKPKFFVIADALVQSHFNLSDYPHTKILFGGNHLAEIASHADVDIVLLATVGLHSLDAAIAAIRAGKRIALANKEILVAAGGLIYAELEKYKSAKIIPVDSEHSAIFQCLYGNINKINRLILTASGGPFRSLPAHKFKDITLKDALKHPNWSMGKKITIDSATLMNKGLEVIEASWLFGVSTDQIECVVHHQSIIHSMVEFEDFSVLAQMSHPTMEIPIAYAFSYPERLASTVQQLDFSRIASLTFAPCDTELFPCLGLAYSAAKRGNAAPLILNSANDMAVELFLQEKIAFTDIAKLIEKAIGKFDTGIKLTIDSVYYIDKEVKQYIAGLLI